MRRVTKRMEECPPLRTSNGALLACQIGNLVRREMLVYYAIETARLALVTIHAILNVLRGVTREMICKAVSDPVWLLD